jgi:hypothetical protein
MMKSYEMCSVCDSETGRAGAGEDAILEAKRDG